MRFGIGFAGIQQIPLFVSALHHVRYYVLGLNLLQLCNRLNTFVLGTSFSLYMCDLHSIYIPEAFLDVFYFDKKAENKFGNK